MDINQDLAKRLLSEGGVFVLLGVPPGTEIGIDIKSWNVAENFRGIKMIPPGIHFIHYNAVDKTFGESAPRVGFFYNFKKSEFLIKQWDVEKEDISTEEVDEETQTKIKSQLKQLDKHLGPYPLDLYQTWKDLTAQIDDNVINRCAPECGYVRSALELEHSNDESRQRGSAEASATRRRGLALTDEAKEDQLLPDLKPKPGTQLRFTDIPEQFYPDDATPAEITKHSLDLSFALNSYLSKMTNQLEIVGELQMAFICFLSGQSLEAFDHWKKLITLLCGVDSTIATRRAIYCEFLKTLEVQLAFVPDELLCDIVASNNFVYQNLRKLFANVEVSNDIDGRLIAQASRFRESLTKKLGWDFTNLQDDEGDEAPVIVSLD